MMERKRIIFDTYMNKLFKKYCPDAARFLTSWNPIARKHAEEDRFFFTVGMLIRNDFSEEEIIDWDIAVAGDVCRYCQQYDLNEPCEVDPSQCEQFEELETKLYSPRKKEA